MVLQLWAHMCTVPAADFALIPPPRRKHHTPSHAIRPFDKGNSQDLFGFLLFPAFVCHIASAPEISSQRVGRVRLPVKSPINEQHPGLCVKVRPASHVTGTGGLHTPHSLRQPCPLPRLTLATCLVAPASASYPSHVGRAVSAEILEMDQLPALLVLEASTGNPSHR